MSELNQLLLELNHKTNFNEHDFYLSKSNYNAFNLIKRWPDWNKKILNISGEKFSGKSHLANIFKIKSSLNPLCLPSEIIFFNMFFHLSD